MFFIFKSHHFFTFFLIDMIFTESSSSLILVAILQFFLLVITLLHIRVILLYLFNLKITTYNTLYLFLILSIIFIIIIHRQISCGFFCNYLFIETICCFCFWFLLPYLPNIQVTVVIFTFFLKQNLIFSLRGYYLSSKHYFPIRYPNMHISLIPYF